MDNETLTLEPDESKVLFDALTVLINGGGIRNPDALVPAAMVRRKMLALPSIAAMVPKPHGREEKPIVETPEEKAKKEALAK